MQQPPKDVREDSHRDQLTHSEAREAAARDVLRVISQSRDTEAPVFDLILGNAARLCHAPMARLHLVDESRLHHRLVAVWGETLTDPAPGQKWPLQTNLPIPQAINGGKVVMIDDFAETQAYLDGNDIIRNLVDVEGFHSYAVVPLFRDGTAIGCITLTRREVTPFAQNEIALVETFAAQAVIAIENVRQFREVQARLEREKASREILDVISRSRDDETPVFDAILAGASHLCHAPLAFLSILDEAGEYLSIAAHHGARPEMKETFDTLRHRLADSEIVSAHAARDRRVIRIDDMSTDAEFDRSDPQRAQLIDVEGVRSYLVVPLTKGDSCFGTLNLYRREVDPFSDDEIALVETFAAQAVIAIENVQQFREVQERLRRERASAEVLAAISQSHDDEKPVFDAILDNACALCNAPLAGLIQATPDSDVQTLAAHRGMFPAAIKLFETGQMPMDRDLSYAARSILDGRLIAFDDMGTSDLYKAGSPIVRGMVDESNIRSVLFVPLIKNGRGIGNLTLFRNELKAFNPSEISLVETFAAQAVIAIENVRQFRELEQLNAELGSRVEAQVGEIERMGRLKRFLPAAVADTVVSSGSEKILSSHRALLGVLFCDIRGFTAFCETAEPEETIEVLQTYHEEMGKLINAHGAGVDHRMGDGIMVLFNDPLPCEDPAGDAVRLAQEMRARMSELCKTWKRMGYRLGFGVGVSLGYATVGMVGFEGRFDYTASGTAINLASRLCDEAEDGEILLSPRASIAVEDDFDVESKGELTLKGLREPLEVFRLTGVS